MHRGGAMCFIDCPIAIINFWHVMLRPLPSARIAYAAAAAHLRLITGTRRCEHITPVLQKLHWLSVHHSKGGVQARVPSPPVVG